MPWGQIVVGPPGSGKTTYCAGVQQFLEAAPLPLRRRTVVVNLDPANHTPPQNLVNSSSRSSRVTPMPSIAQASDSAEFGSLEMSGRRRRAWLIVLRV